MNEDIPARGGSCRSGVLSTGAFFSKVIVHKPWRESGQSTLIHVADPTASIGSKPHSNEHSKEETVYDSCS